MWNQGVNVGCSIPLLWWFHVVTADATPKRSGKKKTSNAGSTPRVMVAMTSNTKGMWKSIYRQIYLIYILSSVIYCYLYCYLFMLSIAIYCYLYIYPNLCISIWQIVWTIGLLYKDVALSCESASSDLPLPKPWANKCPPEKSGKIIELNGGLLLHAMFDYRMVVKTTSPQVSPWRRCTGDKSLKCYPIKALCSPCRTKSVLCFIWQGLNWIIDKQNGKQSTNTNFILAKSVWFICKQNAWASHFKTLVAWWFHPCSAMEFSSSCHFVAAITLSHT